MLSKNPKKLSKKPWIKKAAVFHFLGRKNFLDVFVYINMKTQRIFFRHCGKLCIAS
jgi:hypothetical protein